LGHRLIAATDTAFSSNRFAWLHRIHKVDLQVELKETVVDQLHSSELLKISHPVRIAPADAGACVACTAFPDSQGASL
jgi:hypothetical protein